jgi:hypothetical protein
METMTGSRTMRRGTVLEPLVATRTEQRLCVLLDDATAPQVRLRVAWRDSEGCIQLTPQEFVVPLSALEALKPVEGLSVEV